MDPKEIQPEEEGGIDEERDRERWVIVSEMLAHADFIHSFIHSRLSLSKSCVCIQNALKRESDRERGRV